MRRFTTLAAAVAAAILSIAWGQTIPADLQPDLAAREPEMQLGDESASPLDTLPTTEPRQYKSISAAYYAPPAVFDTYHFLDTIRIPQTLNTLGLRDPETAEWLADENFRQQLLAWAKQQYMLKNPSKVKYNIASMETPPAMNRPIVDPRQHKFTISEIPVADAAATVAVPVEVDRRNWINSIEAALQFSQSYLSPNWYQGGTGNLNSIGNILWTNKLNTAFHPNLMFETTVQYKLAVNNAPDDSVHRYNISEDVFKVTSKFGVKAFNSRWFYSVQMQFKTQFLNNYKKNSSDLIAALFSPGELNMGIGMTYNYARPDGRLSFDASLSPIAWNLKTCSNHLIDPATVGIKSGKRVANQLGSTAECKFKWLITKNITYQSRLYAFSDYSYIQGDWENTLSFDVNRFLSTQIFVHLRYDSSVTPAPEAKWRYWQLKEILSFGLSYKFTTGA